MTGAEERILLLNKVQKRHADKFTLAASALSSL